MYDFFYSNYMNTVKKDEEPKKKPKLSENALFITKKTKKNVKKIKN
jgi:hypothetical protein